MLRRYSRCEETPSLECQQLTVPVPLPEFSPRRRDCLLRYPRLFLLVEEDAFVSRCGACKRSVAIAFLSYNLGQCQGIGQRPRRPNLVGTWPTRTVTDNK